MKKSTVNITNIKQGEGKETKLSSQKYQYLKESMHEDV